MAIPGPPANAVNEPGLSVYWGNGCFWHTQYDTVLVEWDAQGAFRRNFSDITSLVGYAGGRFQAADGKVCYHGLPGTDYSRMGHSEAVEVRLDAMTGPVARAQLAALAHVYFHEGFQDHEGKRLRKDPQDMGPEYRNVIGLPGGMDSELFDIIQEQNVFDMPLLRGQGGTRGDTEDEYVVYVYDSNEFPFFRGESYHQFHKNTVVQRPVPYNYTATLKQAQRQAGRLDDLGCPHLPGEALLLIIACFGAVLSLGVVHGYAFMPLGELLLRGGRSASVVQIGAAKIGSTEEA